MRYTIAVLAFILMAMLNHSSFGQCVEPTNDPTPPDRAAGAGDYQSMYGIDMVAHGTVRALVIFAELEYADPADDPFPSGTPNWPAHQLPTGSMRSILRIICWNMMKRDYPPKERIPLCGWRE